MKLTRALLAGAVGAIAMSLASIIVRLAGIPVNLESLLGSLLDTRSPAAQWAIGFLLHLLIGACTGIGYAVVFEWAVQRSGAMVGAGLGLCHGLMAGLLMSSIPAMNPLGTARFTAPGPFLQNLSFGPIMFVLLHCLYGACVGLVYGPTIQHEHLYTNAPPLKTR